MVLWLLYLAPILSLIIVFVATPLLIRFLRRINLIVRDQNKENRPLVPISGGLAAISGVLIGLMYYIFILVFVYKDLSQISLIFAVLITLLLITFIGFLDDLIINKTQDASIGLRQWQKPVLTLIPAIPLIVINAGTSIMAVPFLGKVDWGIFYPLLLIPLAVVFVSNVVNLLAGINGLETGMGLVYIGMLGVYAYVNQRFAAAGIAAVVFAALFSFYFYNRFPAKILPGDSLTYFLGASLVSIAIVGNIERAALVCLIPFILEFFLKARSKFKAQSYGYYCEGKVKSLHKKIYSLIHFFTIKPRFTEKQITYIFILIELFFSSMIWFI